MIVKFGNLPQPRHSEDPEKPEAEAKVKEMMKKLHEAGFVRETNVDKNERGDNPMSYHVYDLPHQISFGSDEGVKKAIEIMTPYSDYMKPIAVVG